MDTYSPIHVSDIPVEQRKEICFSRVVCEIGPQKEDPSRTCITIVRNHIIFPGEVVITTPTAALEVVKLFVNNALTRPGAKICCFDVKHFYLGTLMECPEYVKIKLTDIPQEFIDEYSLLTYEYNGWVYVEVIMGCYSLPTQW